MANKDYVSRARPANKKNSPYKKKQAKPTGLSLKAKLITSLTLLALGAFAYGLWLLNNQPDKAPTPKTEATANVEKVKKAALPPVPPERWTYREGLKNREVEVGEYEVKQTGPYKLQCGAFRAADRAERLKAEMAFIGLEAKIKVTSGKNGIIHSVYMGPFKKKRTAEQNKHKLKRNKINNCKVLPWR